MKDLFFLNDEIICWIENQIKERLSNQISLSLLNLNNKLFWKLSLDSTLSAIEMPINDNFYNLNNNNKIFFSNFEYQLKSFDHKLDLIVLNLNLDNLSNFLIYEDETIKIDFDIFGLMYWMLNRSEEINISDDLLDEHLRYPYKLSSAYKFNFIDRPIIDEWFYFLRDILNIYYPSYKLNPIKYSLSLSHDVDRPSKYAFANNIDYLKIMYSTLFKQKDIYEFINGLRVKLYSGKKFIKDDKYNSFDYLMDIDSKFGIKSTFNFICDKNGLYSPDYSINNKLIKSLLLKIHQRGFYIGLHPTYNSFNNLKELSKQFLTLKSICNDLQISQKIWTSRMHYLRWKNNFTCNLLNQIGINLDTTLGFGDIVGFRCGTSYSYKMFDPKNRINLKIRQQPLICMDSSLYEISYGKEINIDSCLNKLSVIHKRIKRYGGVFSILWHNCSLQSEEERQLYNEIVSSFS